MLEVLLCVLEAVGSDRWLGGPPRNWMPNRVISTAQKLGAPQPVNRVFNRPQVR